MQFTLEKSPHIASRHSTLRMMCELAAGILVIFLASEIFYYVSPMYGARFGNSGLIALAVCVSVSVACDAIWALPRLWDKKVPETKKRLKNWGFQILHSYGWITGLILTLLMPALPVAGSITPKYIYGMAISAIVGTFLAKDIFGGFGHNIFNPAVVGRVFYQFCFQSWVSSSYVTWMQENAPDLYAINSGASEMSYTQSLGWTTLNNNTSVYKLLFSNAFDGTIGEVLAIVVIAVGIYLAVRQVIDWRTPAFYIGTIFLGTFVMALASGFGVHSFEFAFRQILMGGVLIGGFLCLTDPVTNPTSRTGRVMSATVCAFITLLVRYQAAASEGVALAILTQNMISPLIEKLLVGKQTEHMKRNSILISAVVVVAMVFGGVFGAYHKTSDDFSGTPAYVTEINSMLDSQGIASTIDKNSLVVEDNTGSPVKFTGKGNIGSYSLKVTGFEVNGSVSAYYDVTTTPINAENNKTDEESLKKDDMHVEYGIIVNETGIVAADMLSYNDLVTVTPEAVQACARMITVANPYTSASSFKSLSGDYPSSGASVTAGLTDLCFKAAISDFNSSLNAASLEQMNGILALQNIAAVDASGLTFDRTEAKFAGKGNIGSHSVKITGFTVNSKVAAYYDVTTTPINAKNFKTDDESLKKDDMHVEYGIVVTKDDIVAADMLSYNDLVTVTPEAVQACARMITVANPYTSASSFKSLSGDYPSSGASVTAGLTDLCFKAAIADFNGGK